ncbi:MAG: YfhO family protein, partial [Verrucomicrobia bacterium]|nr:YfhO family protein [Verrucomicrobiota bacterium]
LMWPSHVATFSWMPWVILAVEKAWQDGGRCIFVAVFAGAMQMLAGGPEPILFTWLLLAALWARHFVRGDTSRLPTLWRFPVIVALVAALCAAQLLPFLNLAAHSERQFGYTDLRWSMPAWGWVNFLVPMAFGTTADEGVFFQFGQSWTSSYYLGVAALWLAIYAAWRVRAPRAVLLSVAAIIALIFGMGGHTFLYPELRAVIPQLSLITYPVKYLLVDAFVVPLLAALALAALLERTVSTDRLFFIGTVLLGLLGAVLFWVGKFSFTAPQAHAALLNGLSRAGFILLAAALLFVLARGRESPLFRFAPLLLVLFSWLDVQTHEPPQNPTVPPSVYQPNLARRRLKMQPQPNLGRSRAMISPPAEMTFVHVALSRPENEFLLKRLAYGGNVNLLDSVPKVDGFFSLAPRECDALQSWLYGATNLDFSPLKNFLGVSQVSESKNIYKWQSRKGALPLVTAGQQPLFVKPSDAMGVLGWTNWNPAAVVFLVPRDRPFVYVTHAAPARVIQSRFGFQRVDFTVQSTAPSLAVIAQTFDANWHATVDGHPARLLRANYAFQAVQTPPGRHEVRLAYQDRAFAVGVKISIVTLCVCLAGPLLCRARSPRAPLSPPL